MDIAAADDDDDIVAVEVHFLRLERSDRSSDCVGIRWLPFSSHLHCFSISFLFVFLFYFISIPFLCPFNHEFMSAPVRFQRALNRPIW